MTLSELIDYLEKADQSKIVPVGFDKAYSYRGDYSELAFRQANNVPVTRMLQVAKGALGATFQGYKGGQYTMDDYALVHLTPSESECGEEIGPVLLDYMLGVTT